VGFEALARLTDADGLDIAPDVFISVAEDTGIIVPLGGYMLELASDQLATWREQLPGMGDVTMAVNVSALQAQHASLGEDVERVLAAHRLVPSDLILELTETALLHADRSTIDHLQVLRDKGVGIAIDDFGTGYASLRYLAMLLVSAVKVDRSFTAGLPADETSSKIVNAVAGLAADMKLTCVVEGVESAKQRAALPRGVQLQGWLTGRPERPESLDLRDLVTHGAS
jgi:EAL domain-containing protein (putative c-di-GMP-specific phosphodiesterase class I)